MTAPHDDALVERLRLAAAQYDLGGHAFERDLVTWAANAIERYIEREAELIVQRDECQQDLRIARLTGDDCS